MYTITPTTARLMAKEINSTRVFNRANPAMTPTLAMAICPALGNLLNRAIN